MPAHIASTGPTSPAKHPQDAGELREAFQGFVAGTFFRQMLAALRKTQGEPAYFHGGQAERIFQGQFDQQIADELAARHGGPLADGLFRSFQHQRTGRPLPQPSAAGVTAEAAYRLAAQGRGVAE